MPSRRPTVQDVATLAGLSKSTTARALSGTGSVTARARARALEAARSLGWEPNQLAMSIRSGRSRLVGLVIPDIANPFWAGVARGAQERAEADGLSLLCFSSDWQVEREARHLRALVRARVDGALVNPVADSAEVLRAVGLPLVLLGTSADGFAGVPSVASDVAGCVRLGLDHLLAKGHGAPALIAGPASYLALTRFVGAVREHLAARGLDPDVPVETGDFGVEGGRAAMARLLDRRRPGRPGRSDRRSDRRSNPGPDPGPDPWAVFAANDLMALGALKALRERGLRCPEDVSLMGLDGIPAGDVSWPGLTTVEKPSRAIGWHAVELLGRTLEEGAPNLALRLPGRLIERESVADLTAKTPQESQAHTVQAQKG